MKRRHLSDKYIDTQIAKIDEMFERTRDIVDYPRCMSDAGSDSISTRRLLESDLKEIKAYIKQLRDISFVNGFWHGWTLRDGVNEDEKILDICEKW